MDERVAGSLLKLPLQMSQGFLERDHGLFALAIKQLRLTGKKSFGQRRRPWRPTASANACPI